MRCAVYNSRVPHMMDSPSRQPCAARLLMVILFLSSSVWGADWVPTESQLAQKIAAVTGPGAVAVDFTNRSSLSKNDFDDIRRGLLTELAALGLHFVPPDQASAAIQISFSENLENYVWIAEIRAGASESSVAMVSLSRSGTATSAAENAPLSLRKTLLWSQAERILDAATLEGSPSHLLVLDAGKVTLYKLQDSRWLPEQSWPIRHSRPWPRDLRGRISLRRDHLFDAYLPGVLCQSSTSSPVTMNCRDSDDPWPVGTDQLGQSAFFTPARNFFPGVLVPGVAKQTTAPAFYSAAPLPRERYVLWLFAAVDGSIHLLDGIRDQVLAGTGWGSDVAGVKSGCGLGWQVLATRAGDGISDAVRAFELADREPAPVSQPVGFDGPVTAMWTESNGNSVTAVTQSLDTGMYEAYQLTIACGQ